MDNSAQQTDGSQHEETAAEAGKTEALDQKGGCTVKHLCAVRSKVDGLDYYGTLYDNVDVYWNCVRDYPIVPPEQGITDYRKQGCFRLYGRDVLNEYFSDEEAKAVRDYLSTFKGIAKTTVEM